MRLSKYIISVSKRHKNNHAGVKNGAWCIYYYDDDWLYGNETVQMKRINLLLVPYYKIIKYHRHKITCDDCGHTYPTLTNWYDKNQECNFCSENYDLDELEYS